MIGLEKVLMCKNLQKGQGIVEYALLISFAVVAFSFFSGSGGLTEQITNLFDKTVAMINSDDSADSDATAQKSFSDCMAAIIKELGDRTSKEGNYIVGSYLGHNDGITAAAIEKITAEEKEETAFVLNQLKEMGIDVEGKSWRYIGDKTDSNIYISPTDWKNTNATSDYCVQIHTNGTTGETSFMVAKVDLVDAGKGSGDSRRPYIYCANSATSTNSGLGAIRGSYVTNVDNGTTTWSSRNTTAITSSQVMTNSAANLGSYEAAMNCVNQLNSTKK